MEKPEVIPLTSENLILQEKVTYHGHVHLNKPNGRNSNVKGVEDEFICKRVHLYQI